MSRLIIKGGKKLRGEWPLSGNYLFHEKMFESRLYFIDQLKAMDAKGASIIDNALH